MTIWKCVSDQNKIPSHISKLSFPNSTSTFLIFYPSTFTVPVLRALFLFGVFKFWKFAAKIAIHLFQGLMFVQIQVFLYHSMKQ